MFPSYNVLWAFLYKKKKEIIVYVIMALSVQMGIDFISQRKNPICNCVSDFASFVVKF